MNKTEDIIFIEWKDSKQQNNQIAQVLQNTQKKMKQDIDIVTSRR